MHPKYKEAVDFHRKGQVKEAKNICLEILEDEPKNFDILHLLGIIFFQLKDYKKSYELISEAIKINSNPSIYWLNFFNTISDTNYKDMEELKKKLNNLSKETSEIKLKKIINEYNNL